MAGFCRLCNATNNSNTDAYVACSNCGSLACDQHHQWLQYSHNAFCTDCLPQQAASCAATVAATTQALIDPKGELRHLAVALSNDEELRAQLGVRQQRDDYGYGRVEDVDPQVLQRLHDVLERLARVLRQNARDELF